MARITIDGVDQIIAATNRAVLVRLENLKEVWIPRSLCDNGRDLEVGDTDICVEEWFAEKEGLDG